MTRFQGNVGQEYGLFMLVCPHYMEMRKLVGDTIADNNCDRILEIGCGSGYTTSEILLTNPHSNIIAIDNEPVMIKKAEISLDDYVREGQVEFIEADALLYLQSLESESFDAFVSGFTMHNFRKDYRNELLSEAYRVLRRGGLFVNADKYAKYNIEEHKKDLELRLDKIKSVFKNIERNDLQEEWIKHYLEDENHNVIQREEKSIREMQELGFRHLEFTYRHEMEAILVGIK